MARPETPLLAADVIIELVDRAGRPIVLIERRNPPYGHAIPGGFVDPGETVEQAAVREAREETGLEVELTELLGIYSGPGRDPRGATASVVYIGQAKGEPAAADDALALDIYPPEALPSPLAFDHTLILQHYLVWRREGRLPRPWAQHASS